MKYLIDTHILILFIEGNKQLAEKARVLIANPTKDIYVSYEFKTL
ncbi:MAG TPA: hypothetical protein VK211_01920 [Kamptonema sp.]|nr:hypothetical protein [Kamptonema sp.]